MDAVRVKGEWKCFICTEDFQTNETLDLHLDQVHHADHQRVAFVKLEAPEDREVKGGFGQTENEAPASSSFNCEICGKTFPSTFSLGLHRKRFHSEINVSFCCPECPSVFQSLSSLSRHKTWRHSIIPKLIGKAGTQTRDSQLEGPPTATKSLHSEVTMDSDDNDNVVDYQEKSIAPQGVAYRSQTHSPRVEDLLAKSADCPFCRTSFVDLDDFHDHLKVLHKTEKNFACSLCPFVNNVRKNFINHLKFHFMKMFACGICAEKFATVKLLSLHLKGSHQGQAEHQEAAQSKTSKQHIIEMNEGKVSSNRRESSRTENEIGKIRDNLKANSSWCNICKISISKGNFARHVSLKHSPATTPQTSTKTPEPTMSKRRDNGLTKSDTSKLDPKESTTSGENLDRGSIQSLSGDPKFNACHHCGKIYIRSSNLKEHIMMNHSDEPPKTTSESIGSTSPVEDKAMKEDPTFCKICNRKYSTKDVLKIHMKKLHESDPIRCEICGITFAKRRNLKKYTLDQHMKQFHPSDGQDQLGGDLLETTKAERQSMPNLEEPPEKKLKADDGASELKFDALSKCIFESNGAYRCRLCDKSYSSKDQAYRHAKSAHNIKQATDIIAQTDKTQPISKTSSKSSKTTKPSSKLHHGLSLDGFEQFPLPVRAKSEKSSSSQSPNLANGIKERVDEEAAENPKSDMTKKEKESKTSYYYTSKGVYFCRLCDKAFARPHHVNRHAMNVHKKAGNQLSDEPKQTPTVPETGEPFSKSKLTMSSSFEDPTSRDETKSKNASTAKTQNLKREAKLPEGRATQKPKTDSSGIKIKCPNCSAFTPSMKDLICHMKTYH